MLSAFSLTICGIFRECLITLLSRNEREVVVRMPEPHTIDSGTAIEPHIIDSGTAHDPVYGAHSVEQKCGPGGGVWRSGANHRAGQRQGRR